MTMLDRMRRHKGWLKWSLALVVLAFIIFYIPDFLGSDGGTAAPPSPNDEVARVDGRSITVSEFSRAYQNQLQAYRSAYGQSINEQLLRQLGFEQQILQQLIEQEAAMVEAERLGITVSNDEVRQRILAHAGLPGERPVHRRRPVPSGARHAAPAADAVAVRERACAAS